VALVRRAKAVGHVATDDVVVPGVRAVCLPFGGHGRLPPSAISVATVAARLPQSRVAELLSIMEGMIRKLGTPPDPYQDEMTASSYPPLSHGLTRPVHA